MVLEMLLPVDDNNCYTDDHHDFQSGYNSAVLFKRSRVKFQEADKAKYTSLCWGFGKAVWPPFVYERGEFEKVRSLRLKQRAHTHLPCTNKHHRQHQHNQLSLEYLHA